RLAAILFAGLSRLLPGDEKDSFARLRTFAADVVGPKVVEYGGRIVSVRSEAGLREVESIGQAGRCAAPLRGAAARMKHATRIGMGIGINLGDIIAEDGDVFGDGVNIAARIEALAEPGSVFVSETVYHHIVDKVDFQFEDLGPQSLKNIRRPVRVYRMGVETF